MGYSYYDTPDGEDCFKKLLYTARIAAVSGVIVSVVDVRLFSRTQGFYPTVARFAHFTFPFIGMAAAFTATTCIATSARHKDDKLNYFLGGCVAGGVFGAWRKSILAGFTGSLILGALAVAKKVSLEEGWQFIPKGAPLRKYGNVRMARHDWTLTAPRPKTWKESED
ncbi:NADH dehydrogenase [ubiquinone] 1 alpha subcomplex subunit 11 [Zootermopsis nevadensis]|uniref:NADH dehydrogenase [ubiquinone] 1 alpha subcomplex subunit 11 n=1 Tax=Zootermopsis nevadensis TaxID=136037 RepID=A0A067RHJ5_ZOONE|nr:NADH dehydrogenase [ubiquinone] 1 alpha subcomplex subunit 11 [Zootermopsis nevadensis]KDR18623.1 NADH dehydrogenase [ubiquinone] 1 alpha subcomplex subunit 11 [Zootermopsis nevadensis]